MQSLIDIIFILLDLLSFVVIVHVIMSWLISFGILNPHQPLVATIWDSLDRLLDPIYSRIRQFLPNTGALDLSPLILFIGITIIRILVQNNFA